MNSVSILVEKKDFFDLMTDTMEICAAMQRHEDVLSSGEVVLMNDTIALVRLLVNHYVRCGLSEERKFWELLDDFMKKTLKK